MFWPRSSANKVQPNLFCGCFCVITVNAFWKFLRLGKLAWDFCRLIYGPRNFLGFDGSPADFLGFDFCPHLIIPVT